MVRIEKTAENSLDYSLHNTLRQALFLPTSRESKYKAKAAIDTFFFRMGDVIAGLGIVFLLVEMLGLGVRAFAILNVVLGGVWLVLAYRSRQALRPAGGRAPTRDAEPVLRCRMTHEDRRAAWVATVSALVVVAAFVAARRRATRSCSSQLQHRVAADVHRDLRACSRCR